MGMNDMIRLVLDVSHTKRHKLYRIPDVNGEAKKTMLGSG